jgi:hypothetical protein
LRQSCDVPFLSARGLAVLATRENPLRYFGQALRTHGIDDRHFYNALRQVVFRPLTGQLTEC